MNTSTQFYIEFYNSVREIYTCDFCGSCKLQFNLNECGHKICGSCLLLCLCYDGATVPQCSCCGLFANPETVKPNEHPFDERIASLLNPEPFTTGSDNENNTSVEKNEIVSLDNTLIDQLSLNFTNESLGLGEELKEGLFDVDLGLFDFNMPESLSIESLEDYLEEPSTQVRAPLLPMVERVMANTPLYQPSWNPTNVNVLARMPVHQPFQAPENFSKTGLTKRTTTERGEKLEFTLPALEGTNGETVQNFVLHTPPRAAKATGDTGYKNKKRQKREGDIYNDPPSVINASSLIVSAGFISLLAKQTKQPKQKTR